MSRAKALATEIERWKRAGKRRNTALLERLTKIPRSTLKAATDGKSKINSYYVIRILSVIASPETLRKFVAIHLPELMPFVEKLAASEAKHLTTDSLSDIECKVLTDAVFEDTRADSHLSSENSAVNQAVEKLIAEEIIVINGDILAPSKELLIANSPTTESLAKYASRRLDLSKVGNHASVWIGNCDDATRDRFLELEKEIELRYGDIMREYKPGPHRLAKVSFVTDLGG
jgi:hypothetical protein